MTDIVERLRELEAVESELALECDCPPEATANYRYAMTCAEAADTITALRAENERLRAELREMDAHMEENITLTEALRHEQEWVLRLSKALRGVIRVADRNTVEFNEARAALEEKP